MFESEFQAMRAVMKMSRPTLRGTLMVAALYATQAVICVIALKWIYSHQHWNAVLWAMISAVLALQPGLSQSAVTSVIRILANTVGAGVALGAAQMPMRPELQLILALVIVVFTCELLRLELALRTACVAAMIVLSASDGHVLSSGTERFSATVVGCLMALLVQLATDSIRKTLPEKSREIGMVKS